MDVVLPHLVKDVDRHGNVRHYVRKRGLPKIRIKEPVGSPPFLLAYDAALKALNEGKSSQAKRPIGPLPNTLAWLGREYAKSYGFRQLDARTQRVRLADLQHCFDEPTKPGASYKLGDCPLSQLEPKHIRVMRDRKSDAPASANNRLKALRVMFKWAVEAEHLKHNPAAEVDTLKFKSEGFHSWTPEEVKQFEAKHEVGSKPRLAMSLMLYTGVRRSDAVELGHEHVKDGVLTFTPRKTKGTTGKALKLPVLPQLQAILDATPLGEKAFIVTSRGVPFTSNGFGNWFREQCDAAGLGHCTAHGLRKAGATIAAENGATEKQMMAIFGWNTSALASHYSKAASQQKLAGDAMHLLISTESGS